MRLSRSMVLPIFSPLAAMLLVGCNSPAPKPAPAPVPQAATPEQAGQIQADIVKIVPGAVVGHVASVSGHQAAVVGIAVDGVPVGASIQFTDANSVGIANGTVFSKDKTTSTDFQFLIVDFEPMTTAGGRAPIKGDLAIFIPAK